LCCRRTGELVRDLVAELGPGPKPLREWRTVHAGRCDSGVTPWVTRTCPIRLQLELSYQVEWSLASPGPCSDLGHGNIGETYPHYDGVSVKSVIYIITSTIPVTGLVIETFSARFSA